MSNRIRRTRITTERHDYTIIRRRGAATTKYCGKCQMEVAVFRAGEIAAILGVSEDMIDALKRSGEVHLLRSSETDDPVVCGNFLNNHLLTNKNSR